MEKRLIIAFALSFVVLLAFQALFPPPPPAPAIEPVTATENATPPSPPPTGVVDIPRETAPAETFSPTAEKRAEVAEELVFDNALYTATVSNAGGVLKSFKLKAYADAEGAPIQLINEEAGAKLGWPLAIETMDPALNEALANANYVAVRQRDGLSMEFAGGGIHSRKVLEFNRDNYEFSLRSTLSLEGKSMPHSIVWQGGFGDQSITPNPLMKNAVYQAGGAFEVVNLGSIEEPTTVLTSRAGIDDQYFLAAFLLSDANSVKIHKEDYAASEGATASELYVSASVRDEENVRVYVGPKDRRWLSQADSVLPAVIDYGFFEFIARPLFELLLVIHSYVGNFGWAIIILTIVINLLLFPLRLKQHVSMQKMMKIQPQMKTLQDKYKKLKANDPRRAQLQSEMMGLYKEHGVNPLGGCLPLVLQMPVFFGLYSMLSVSIELRRAPWILWIKDLSSYDPYYVLPSLFAGSMLVMTRMTPTAMDPAQAKMMMIMPVVFSVMFLWVQAGLTLYWVTGNVVGIGQQVFINKYWSPRVDAKLQARKQQKEHRGK